MKPLICFAVLVLISAKFGVAEEKKAAEARQFESHSKHVPKYSYSLELHPAHHTHGTPPNMANPKLRFSPVYDKVNNQHVIDLLNVGDIKEFISKEGKSLISKEKSSEKHKEGLSNYRTQDSFSHFSRMDHKVLDDRLISNIGTERHKEGLSNFKTEYSFSHIGSDDLKELDFGNTQFGVEGLQNGLLNYGSNISPKHISETKQNKGTVLKHSNSKYTSINLEHLGNQEEAKKSSYGGTIHSTYVTKLNNYPQVIQLESSKHVNDETKHTDKNGFGGHQFESQIGSISATKPSGTNIEVYNFDDKTKTLIDLTKLYFGDNIDDKAHIHSKSVIHKDVPILKYQVVQKKPDTEIELLQKAVDSSNVIIKQIPVAYAKYIDKPYPLKIYVEKPILHHKVVKIPYKVEIPKPIAVEKEIPFPVKFFEQDPKPYPVYKDIPVPITIYIDKPVPKYVEIPYPVKVVREETHKSLKNSDSDDSKHIEPLTWDEFEAVKASSEKPFSEHYKPSFDTTNIYQNSPDLHEINAKTSETKTKTDDWKSHYKPVVEALETKNMNLKTSQIKSEPDERNGFKPTVGNSKYIEKFTPKYQKWKSVEQKLEKYNDNLKTSKLSDIESVSSEFNVQNWKLLNSKPVPHNYDFQTWKFPEDKQGSQHKNNFGQINIEDFHSKQYSEWKTAENLQFPSNNAPSHVVENLQTTLKGERWSPQIREVFVEADLGNSEYNQDDLKSKYQNGGSFEHNQAEYSGKYLDPYTENYFSEIREGDVSTKGGVKENEEIGIGNNKVSSYRNTISENQGFPSDYISGNDFNPISFSPFPGKVFDEKHSLIEFKESKSALPYSNKEFEVVQNDEQLKPLGYSTGKQREVLPTKVKRHFVSLDGRSNEDFLKTLDIETSASEHVTTKKQLNSEISEKQKGDNGSELINQVADKRSENHSDIQEHSVELTKSTNNSKKMQQQRTRKTNTGSKPNPSSSTLSKDKTMTTKLKNESILLTTEAAITTTQLI